MFRNGNIDKKALTPFSINKILKMRAQNAGLEINLSSS